MNEIILKRTISGNSGPIYSACEANGFLYTASADKFVVRWDIKTGEQTQFVVQCSSAPYSICATSNQLWIGLSNGDIHVIDLVQKSEIKFFKQHQTGVFNLFELKKHPFIFSTDATGLLCIWNKDNLSLDMSLPLNCGKIRSISANADETLLAIPSQDGEIRILETKGFNEIIRLKGHDLGSNTCLFSEDGEYLFSAGKDGKLNVWDWKNEKCIHSHPIHYQPIYGLINWQNSLVTVSRDKSIKTWQMDPFLIHQKIAKPGAGHTHSVNGIFHLGENFATYSDDKKVKIWGFKDEVFSAQPEK